MISRGDVLNISLKSSDINEYLMTLYNLPIQIKAKTIVELGAGYSTIALLAAANFLDAEFISVDMGENSWFRGYPDDFSIYDNETGIERIQEDDMEVFKTWDKEIDFLFLDTSHSYEQTKKELANWPFWVRLGGMFVMHDTAHETGLSVGCREALDECMTTSSMARIADGYFTVAHLLDTKILGMTVMVKI
jgi:predicted O-methyltransferase YrrM